jgi:hypothetical protein
MACTSRWGFTPGGTYARKIACGKCTACRIEATRQWAIRCMHEAQMHEFNCYITLTYNEENLPKNENLCHEDFQLFMKRLRKHFAGLKQNAIVLRPGETIQDLLEKFQNKISFYMAGEYGSQNGRPHYHALIFGGDFHDKQYQKTNQNGDKLYTSPTLDQLWKKGYANIGAITFQSAAYVARYVMKKYNGDITKTQKYDVIDQETGEIKQKKTEYSTMSRRQAIGKKWIKKYTADVYPHGLVVVNGREQQPPKAYDRYHKKTNPLAHEKMVQKRMEEAQKRIEDSSNERLQAKETVLEAKLKQLKRTI